MSVPQEFQSAFHYNLGNAHAALARFERGRGPWRRVASSRAVQEFDESLRIAESPETRTNLANAFRDQWRLFEALDEYDSVLQNAPQHHQALGLRAGCFVQLSTWVPDHSALLLAAFRDYDRALQLARNDIVFASSYRQQRDALRGRIRDFPVEPVAASEYQHWIWDSQLALNPCPICRVDTPDAFDLFPLQGHFSAQRRRPSTAVVLDTVNRLCQGYATARWHLFSAVSPTAVPDDKHQVYVPTSSGAEFGLTAGLLMSACTGFFSVLNNVAYALNVYFNLGMLPKDVTLETVWHGNGSRTLPQNESSMRRRLNRPDNHGLTALFELTRSLARGKGRYAPLRELRNGIEHRLVLAHSSSFDSEGPLVFVDRPTLRQSALALGRVAKAAVWYLSAAILHEERRRLRRALRSGEPVGRGQSPTVWRA